MLRSIGLTPNAHDPCLYTGFVRDPWDPSASHLAVPLSLGLYIDNFVYFLEDPNVEALFERLLHERVKVDFMGLVEGFLSIHFSWRFTSLQVDVHLNQTDWFCCQLGRAILLGFLEPYPHGYSLLVGGSYRLYPAIA
jgi:hypothetical protein